MFTKIDKGFWIHQNSMDMFIEILKVQYRGPKYTKIKYRCWNKSQTNNPFLIDTKVFKGKILKDEYQNWSRYAQSQINKI